MAISRVGVILMTYGSPATLDDIPVYLKNVRGGRPPDETLIAECRQVLAIIQMPEAKLLRVPENWDRYRADVA